MELIRIIKMKKDFFKKLILGFFLLVIVAIIFIRISDIALFLNIRLFLRDLLFEIKNWIGGLFS